MRYTIEEIAAKMDGLGIWKKVAPYNWAIVPRGTVLPYFCTLLGGGAEAADPVKMRFLLLEGWQTFHDYVRTRIDHDFGFYSSPMEFAHFELVFAKTGEVRFFRHDPVFVPREANAEERAYCARMLWEAYGVMLRIEAEPSLTLKFSGERSIFARFERGEGVWEDGPLAIPDPQPHVEQVSYRKDRAKLAADLPFDKADAVAIAFGLKIGTITNEPRPRCVYELTGTTVPGGERFLEERHSPNPDGALKAMWEGIPARVLEAFIRRGRVPGEIRVKNQRMFRLLRPLGIELPFRIILHG